MDNSSDPDYALVDRAGAASMLFYPRPDPEPAPDGAIDLIVPVEPGISLGARFYAFDSEAPTILYFHGNGEVASDHDGVAHLYQQAGANLLVVEFRGYGRSDGRPTFKDLVLDGRAVADWCNEMLEELGFTGARFVMGRSLGSYPALEVAANRAERFSGLIIESGTGSVTRLVARVVGQSPEATALAEAYTAKVRCIELPVLIIHGEQDELIPVASAFELRDVLGQTACELVVIPRAGHNDLLWLGIAPYFEAVGRFIKREA